MMGATHYDNREVAGKLSFR